MSIFSGLFGSKKAVPEAEEPKPIDESVLEWRRLNELPVPVLKPLPLDKAAVDACGSPSSLHPPVKPAKVIDEVPQDYHGDLYYRIVGSQRGSWRNPINYVVFAKKGLKLEDQPAQRLAMAGTWLNHVAQGKESHLFLEPGELRPEFRKPLPAKLSARGQKRPFPEYSGAASPIVSSRIRRVIEALEPGVHLFIPIDTSEGEEEPDLFVFFPGVMFAPTGLAIESNGIAQNMLPNGGIQFMSPQHLSKRHFYLLNRNVIGDAQIFTDSWFRLIFSQRALERLGDVLHRELAFMPMGVCDEPIPANAEKRTRDGGVEPLGAG